ncbi:MAG: hypothetical protein WC831_02575 [Parcubacteria group bacterium]|jgi:hypothetical protein
MAWTNLENGWILVNGPTIQYNTQSGFNKMEFSVDVTAFHSKEKKHFPREPEGIYPVCRISIPNGSFFLNLPEITIVHAELWGSVFLKEKILTLLLDGHKYLHDPVVEVPFNYLVSRVRGEEKNLRLADGSVLKGNLWRKRIGDDVLILGRIRRGEEEMTELVFRLTMVIQDSIFSSPREPLAKRVEGRHPLWCPKLAALVVEYIRQLARYNSDFLIREYLNELANEIEADEPWGRTVADVRRNLLAVPVDLREALTAELAQVEQKLNLKLV